MATSSVAVLAALLLLNVNSLSAVPYPHYARGSEFYDVVHQLLDLESGMQDPVRFLEIDDLWSQFGCCGRRSFQYCAGKSINFII